MLWLIPVDFYVSDFEKRTEEWLAELMISNEPF